jgi:predicted nucleotidyltransferase
MHPEAIITALRAHEPELRAAGVTRLSMFGSTAHGEARPDSDIDLLAAFDQGKKLSLLDVIRIENQIADLLGQAVDLIEEGTLRPRVRQSAEREALRAF